MQAGNHAVSTRSGDEDAANQEGYTCECKRGIGIGVELGPFARGHGDLSQDMLRRGIYQVLTLEGGYASAAARPAIEALQQKLFVPLAL